MTTGTNRAFVRASSRLFEFDQKWGICPGNRTRSVCAFIFAQAVRIDPQDNIWVVDEGGSMVIKFDPEGHVVMTFGRKPEAITVPSAPPLGSVPVPALPATTAGAAAPAANTGAGAPGDSFNRPTDVAWDVDGNIFVADGYDNSRNREIRLQDGKYIKSWGQRGAAQGQFHTPHSIAVDAKGIWSMSADQDNHRIQVFDNDGNFKSQYINIGDPWGDLHHAPGAHQYLFSSNSNDPYTMDNGEIYKMELDGKIVGMFGHAGKQIEGIRHRERDRLPESERNLRWRNRRLAGPENHATSGANQEIDFAV